MKPKESIDDLCRITVELVKKHGYRQDVYVRPPFRHQGLGRALFQAVARIGAERNCGRLEWTALNWNQDALEFYRSP